LKETFHILPEYLEDIEGKEGEVNFCDHGIQLTRGFRALKLWMSLQVFGRAGFREALNRGFELAEVAEAAVRELPNWEVVTPAQMGIVTFRCIPQGLSSEKVNWLNRELVEEMIADGFAMVSSTILRGQTVLRMCTINPRTAEADVRETIKRFDDMSKGLLQ
jgi:aromatic-L-amino-acid decarboxylase